MSRAIGAPRSLRPLAREGVFSHRPWRPLAAGWGVWRLLALVLLTGLWVYGKGGPSSKSDISGGPSSIAGVSEVEGAGLMRVTGVTGVTEDGRQAAVLRGVGGWGRLEAERVYLQAPRRNIQQMILPDTGNPWLFVNSNEAEVEALLLRAGFEPGTVRGAMLLASPKPEVNGLMVRPLSAVVDGLSPSGRALIYRVLSKYDHLNPDQGLSLAFAGESVEQWLDGAPLREETVALVKRYAYRNEVFVFMSDLAPIRRRLGDPEEYDRLVQALHRESTWRLWLRVGEGEDIAPLVAYWGVNGRETEVEPLLRGLAQTPGGGRIDVTRLLPEFAHDHLYTYPDGAYRIGRNCHWASANFFNTDADESLEEEDAVELELKNKYESVPLDDLRFGDLIRYIDSDSGVIHTSVYIADNMVLTKNGPMLTRPFMLMRLDEVVHYYTAQGERTTIALRRREAVGASLSMGGRQ